MSKSLNFDNSLEKLGILFRYSGMNLQNKIVKFTDIIKYRWLYILNFGCELTSTTALIYSIIIDILNGKNIMEVTSLAPCLSYTFLGIFKSIFHLIYEENVQELIALLRDLEIKENNKENCVDKAVIIDKESAFLNRVINVLYALNFAMLVVFDMTPLILIAIKYYKTNEFAMLLPYLDVFKYLPYKFKYWPFAYLGQIWAGKNFHLLLLFTASSFTRAACGLTLGNGR